METVNISLTPEQSEFVRRTVARDFGNVSEYFRELIRERMTREIEADLAFLEKTSKGAPAGPGEQEIKKVVRVQREVRKTLRREGRL
jgi:Arc/MetJ-type ribon-helix-helix transcriptional regulator